MQSTSVGGRVAATPAPHSRLRPAPLLRRESARRRLVGVVFLVYLLLIFEGSIRKWVLPELSAYIFFIRDPFVLYAYLLATRYGLWPRSRMLLAAYLGMGLLALLVGSAQLATTEGGPLRILIAAYGWRNYFLYMPLAALIGAQFREEDLLRIWRWTLFLSVPIGILVVLQFFAPLNAAINVGVAADSGLQFVGLGLDAEHTRPMGTFSSGAGQIQFVASAFAIWLGLVIAPAKRRRVSRWLLLIAAAGLALCLAFGGMRASMLHCALITVLGMGLVFVGRTTVLKLRSVLLPLVAGAAFVVLYPILFPQGFDAFVSRWETAARAENKTFQGGVFGRALYGFVDFSRLLDRAPLLGYGLGIGGNASTTLGVKIAGDNPVSLAETDWARHIVDLGPVLGLGYIAFRVVLTILLGVLVLKATRRGAGPIPLLLFAYVGYVLLLNQITGQGAINGYAWLFAGFCIAAAKQLPGANRRTARHRAFAAPLSPRATGPAVAAHSG